MNPTTGYSFDLFLAFSLVLLLPAGLESGHFRLLVVIDLVNEQVESGLLVLQALVVVLLLTRSRYEH